MQGWGAKSSCQVEACLWRGATAQAQLVKGEAGAIAQVQQSPAGVQLLCCSLKDGEVVLVQGINVLFPHCTAASVKITQRCGQQVLLDK